MKDPARTWNAVVVGEDTPCWSGTRRHERLKAGCCGVRIAAGRTDVGSAVRPPALIRTERLVLRESQARDRVAFVELFDSPEAGVHVGGARPREESR